MDDEPLHSDRPPDEAWWERELHRNEKLMDKYMSVLGENPDWDKWQDPEDLYNKVHFGIDPPARGNEKETEPAGEGEAETGEADEAVENEPETEQWSATEQEEDGPELEDPDADPETNEDYEGIATIAREFACAVFDLENVPTNSDVLFLSAGKIGANLAGGHGLGYEDDAICGNVVKCRWALSDCEFCREILEELHQKTGEARYAQLAGDAAKLAEAISDRVARLRKRVWW